MNLIVLNKNNFIKDNIVRIEGRQFEHVINVHRNEVGNVLRVGLIDGKLGTGRILSVESDYLTMSIDLTEDPPNKLPLKLILAMPRPKVFKRLIEDCTTLGINEIHLIKTWKVEKSYWSTPWLNDDKILGQMLLGLEQGKDTILPKVYVHQRFKPFVEDEVPEIIEGTIPIIAHPRLDNKIKLGDFYNQAVTVAIGPEGGFTDYELEKFKSIGFEAVSLSDRILRVETAIKVIVGRLYY